MRTWVVWLLSYGATFTAFLILGAAVVLTAGGGAAFIIPLAFFAPLFVPDAYLGALLYAPALVIATALVSVPRATAIVLSPLAVTTLLWRADGDLLITILALVLAPMFGAVVPLPPVPRVHRRVAHA